MHACPIPNEKTVLNTVWVVRNIWYLPISWGPKSLASMTLITRLINSNPTEATILNRVDCEKFIFQKYQIYIYVSFLPHRSYMLTYMAILTNFTFPSYDNAVWMRKDKSPHNGISSNIRCISPLDKDFNRYVLFQFFNHNWIFTIFHQSTIYSQILWHRRWREWTSVVYQYWFH